MSNIDRGWVGEGGEQVGNLPEALQARRLGGPFVVDCVVPWRWCLGWPGQEKKKHKRNRDREVHGVGFISFLPPCRWTLPFPFQRKTSGFPSPFPPSPQTPPPPASSSSSSAIKKKRTTNRKFKHDQVAVYTGACGPERKRKIKRDV